MESFYATLLKKAKQIVEEPGEDLATSSGSTRSVCPGDITPAYNQQIQQLLIVLEEARLLTLILAILCGNCIYVLDSNSMSATQLRRLKLDATSVKTTELLQKLTQLTVYVATFTFARPRRSRSCSPHVTKSSP